MKEKDMNDNMETKSPTIYQTIENCQVYNGPISGCVFAMPGATVNHTATQQVNAMEPERQTPRNMASGDINEELFKFIHPSLPSEQEGQIHVEIKRLVRRLGIQEICQYLLQLKEERKVLLPQNAERAYLELVRMGMPDGEGYSLKTFTKYYKR